MATTARGLRVAGVYVRLVHFDRLVHGLQRGARFHSRGHDLRRRFPQRNMANVTTVSSPEMVFENCFGEKSSRRRDRSLSNDEDDQR